jgi:hypothetical protein
MTQLRAANWRRADSHPPKPVSQFNGLANRQPPIVTARSGKTLRHIKVELSTDLHTDSCPRDPDLTEIVDSWEALPEAIKASILTMVRNATNWQASSSRVARLIVSVAMNDTMAH